MSPENPHNNIGKWIYSTINLRARDWPQTCAAFVEKVDREGNYRGIEIGRFQTDGQMRFAINADKRRRGMNETA